MSKQNKHYMFKKELLAEKLMTSTLGQVWNKMRELHFPSLELSTQRSYERKWDVLKSLKKHPMSEITSAVINNWIQERKIWYQSDEYKNLKREVYIF